MPHDAVLEIDPYTCPNCGLEAMGKACQGCGQKRIRADEMRLRQVLGVAVEETFHINGKLPYTLKCLFFHPGRLTVDYLAGRRLGSIKPIPLYLMCLAAYFFFNHYTPINLQLLVAQQPANSKLLEWVDQEAQESGQTRAQYVAEREPRFQEARKTASLLLDLVVLTPGLFLLYRRQRPFLAEHLVMTLHINSFTYLFGLLPLAVMYVLGGESIPISLLCLVINFSYVYLALRRVYGQGRGITAAKLAVLIFLNLSSAVLGTAAVMILALLR